MQGMGKAPRARKPTFFKGVVLGAVTSMLMLMASTAFATHAGVFTLGHTNTVDATSVLTGSASQLLHVKNTKSDTPAFAVHAEAQGPDPAMRVTNTGTGPGLGITVAPGVPPIRTFSTAKVNNLNVDLLDGLEGASFLQATGKAADSDKLDGIDSTAFLQNGSAAGGRLSGTYPNPTIPVGSITGTDINEGTLAQVPSAVIADDATPYAYGLVNANGTLNTTSGSSQNIASVSKYIVSGTARTGVYCISVPAEIAVRSAVASAQFSNIGNDADAIVNVFVNIFTTRCPSGTDAIVTIWDASANAFDDEDFYIWLLR